MTAERILPGASLTEAHRSRGTISHPARENDVASQFAGLEALEALAVTSPLKAIGDGTLIRRECPSGSVSQEPPRVSLNCRVWEQRSRLLLFAVNGMIVFAVGILIQVLLVRYVGMGHVSSYIAQTIASVQISFLLSRFLTWRDRDVPLARAWARFNLQQLAVTGLGMAGYAGLEWLGMNYITANVAVTAVLTPVSFLSSHKWSLAEKTHPRWRLVTAPWPLAAVLTVQAVLALRLVKANTAFIDEATYLYAGSQELDHWIHGGPVFDYQLSFSGSPAVYPPLGAIANVIGGLPAARILGLLFILGSTTFLFLVANRLFSRSAALLGSALFAALGTTQFLSGFATYDPMALFLLVLSVYLVIGRNYAVSTLSDIAISTAIAPAILALANATKYATALWDPVVIGLVACATVIGGRTWRDGRNHAVRFTIVLASVLGVGLAIGKGKYLHGILYTTVDRSSSQTGMGQSPALVLDKTWAWIGIVIVTAAVGMSILALSWQRNRVLLIIGALFMFATIAAPLNQARIGTTTSLQKHVVFGAWFGCILAGYGLERILRYKLLVGTAALATLTVLSAYYTRQATAFYDSWRPENTAFIAGLRELVRPGSGRYLIEGYDDIPAYYVGASVTSLQWKEAVSYSYTDPQTGVHYRGDPALADAIKNKVFHLIILNYHESQDYAIAGDITRYKTYRVVGHLPPSSIGSHGRYTVWQAVGLGL